MATVTGVTAERIDELTQSNIISGVVNAAGHLILTTQGGAELDAGLVTKSSGTVWSPDSAYANGDVVGYAGGLWSAESPNTNKPPALFNSIWKRIAGDSSNDWSERDPYFTGDSLSESYDFSFQTGAAVASLTSTAGEFETGSQALKIAAPVSATQRFFIKEENIVRDGEIITVTVRARLSVANATASISAELLQSGADGVPEPGGFGATTVVANEGTMLLTNAWETYNFTMPAAAGKPRAVANIVVAAGASAAATFLIDRVRTTRASNPALEAWPVASVFFTTTNVNPKKLLGGGTWVAWGVGRMPVGVDSTQTEFNTVEETGGAKTVTLTTAQIPSHDHSITHDHTNSSLNYQYFSDTTAGGGTKRVTDINNETGAGGNSVTADINVPAFSGRSGDTGGGDAHNNLPPYITCYMWKRTA